MQRVQLGFNSNAVLFLHKQQSYAYILSYFIYII